MLKKKQPCWNVYYRFFQTIHVQTHIVPSFTKPLYTFPISF